MDKKTLKWYEAPEMELIDVKLQGMLCGSESVYGGTVDDEDDITGGNGGLFGD